MNYSDYEVNILNLCDNEDDYNILLSLFDNNSNIDDIENTYNYISNLKTFINNNKKFININSCRTKYKDKTKINLII